MDLSLYIGSPRSRRRRRCRGGLDHGSPILRSPAPSRTSSASASSSSSTEEFTAAAADTQPALGAAPHSPYSPSYPLFADPPDDLPPISGGVDAPVSASSPLSPLYDPPPLPDGPPAEPLAGGGSVAGGVSPPYAPFSPTPAAGGHELAAFTPYQPVAALTGFNLGNGDRVSLLSDHSESEFRIRMLIELRRRLQSIRQFQSAVSSIHNPTEELVHSLRRSGEGRADLGKNGARLADLSSEGSEEEKRDGGSGAANFECNICLEIAKEPVVTCCGHLFCWPCLHQWLHLYCSHRECPVCKGEVDESSITPIYGRGSTETAAEGRDGDVGDSGLWIPPRPRGRRAESWRQGIPRPVSIPPPNLLETGLAIPPPNQDGVNWDWFHLGSSDRRRRLAAFTARLSRVFGRSASSSNHSGGPALSANPRNPHDPFARPSNGLSQGVDQFSTSSTMAVMQDDAEVAGVATEPNSAGSSTSLGRRGRSSFSGSSDADGCLLHACKRRRLN